MIKNSKKVDKEKGNRNGKYQMLVEIDDLDRKILALLQENSRVPFTQIAKELDVPDTTVHFRVKKLLE
ncbi:MAG: Lrp/AsnC family transcriptional regulator, partial [Candidatus Freyarchaeota archaeon]